jgi:hypothetical protein
MFSIFLSPAYAPFAFAFVLMIGLGLIEAIGLGSGHLQIDADGEVGHGGLLDWLGLGELPILVWLTSLLGCFTLVGIAIQQIATGLLGSPISPFIAGGLALFGGGALNTFAANGLARILPGYESTVVSSDDLLRSRGTILEGSARRGHPARAKVVDRHGQAHYVMVEPHADDCVITQGETALLVRRDGTLFFALPDASALQPL